MLFNLILDTADAVLQEEAKSQAIISTVMVVGFLAVMYFLIYMPQKKRDKKLKEQMDKLCIGDKVVTIGGLTGIVAHIDEDEITIYTSVANTPVNFTKPAIQTVIPRNSESEDKKSKKSDK